MDMNKDADRTVFVGRNAEIDTRAPFRSVKEAVTLFGEKVLGEEHYANKLKEMNGAGADHYHEGTRLDNVSAELEETRQGLKKAREESMLMANWISSLQHELERTKQELQQWKQRETEKRPTELEIVDIKFEDNSMKFEMKSSTSDDEGTEFQKKRYVTFANPPSEAHVIVPQGVQRFERHPSLKKKKKKPLIPLLGGIFSKNKVI